MQESGGEPASGGPKAMPTKEAAAGREPTAKEAAVAKEPMVKEAAVAKDAAVAKGAVDPKESPMASSNLAFCYFW